LIVPLILFPEVEGSTPFDEGCKITAAEMNIATFIAMLVVLVCVVNIANATYGDSDDGDWG